MPRSSSDWLERRPLIVRLVKAEALAHQGQTLTEFLDSLRIVKANQLTFQYRLQVGDQKLQSEPEPVEAIWVATAGTLYVAYDEPRSPLWSHCPGTGGGHQTGSRRRQPGHRDREVLAAGSYDEAARFLDEMGYP